MNSEPSEASTGEPRTAYEVQLTDAECIAALRFNQSRLLQRLPSSYLGTALRVLHLIAWAGFGIFACYSVRWFVGEERDPLRLLWWLSLVIAPWTSLLTQLEFRGRMFRSIAAADSGLHDRRTISLELGGLRASNAHGETWVPWSAIQSIEDCKGLILLYYDEVSFIAVPPSTFPNASARAEFLADIRRRVSVATPAVPKPPAEPSAYPLTPAPTPQLRPFANLYTQIIHGFGLALFRRPKLELGAPEQSWSTFVALVMLNLAASLIGGWVAGGRRAVFTATGVPGVLFTVPIVIITAWALTRLHGVTQRTLGLATVMISLALPVGIVEVLFRIWGSGPYGQLPSRTQILLAAWFTLASTLAAIRLLGIPTRRWLSALFATAVCLGAPLATFYGQRSLWWRLSAKGELVDQDDEDEMHAPYRSLTKEDVFYRQPKLLEEQLARLKPSRPGVTDLYFVGVAGDAYQDVFMKEVQSMTKLLDERFDTAERSLMLINNAKTVDASPIASATALRTTLKRLSEIMDRNEDILFLFITSHGSKEKGVAFEFFPLNLEELGPLRLKSLLDEYGIKRRVVVVSACYSGQYVDVLKDDDTLVISASASDRNSFGCSNDAEFTYFGKAYFDALQQTYSFVDAFDLAKPAIARRESQEHFRHSEPAMFVGKNIKGPLEIFAWARQSEPRRKSAKLTE